MLLTVPPTQTTRVTERAIDIIDVLTQKQPQRGVYARWQMVNGKLACTWLRNPD